MNYFDLSMINKINKTIPQLRISQILSGAVNAITYTLGDDGKPLNGKSGNIKIIIPAGSTVPTAESVQVGIRVNGINSDYWNPFASSSSASYAALGNIRNNISTINADINIISSNSLQITSLYANSNVTPSYLANGSTLNVRMTGISSITSLYLFVLNSYTFPVGTIFEYREVSI